ncbi:MAG: FlgD immunoglobulin-like domain containing protein [Chthoniobacterales bacterium]
MKYFHHIFLCLFFAVATASAQDRTVQFMFTPPPLEGKFSIGIYNAQGKVIRALFTDASPSSFLIGLNGYQVSWDGKDDSGKPAPAGKYSVRGYILGAVKIEGEAFHFNDWVTADDAPILERIQEIDSLGKEDLFMKAKTSSGVGVFDVEADSGEVRLTSEAAHAAGKKSVAPPPFLNFPEVLSVAAGKDHTWWAVLSRPDGDKKVLVLGQFSADGTFLRELPHPADEPPFAKVVTNPDSSLVWVLSQDETRQILRALRPAAAAPDQKADAASSDWDVVFERKNESCANFGFQEGKILPNGQKDLVLAPLKLSLIPNELEPDVAQSASLKPLAWLNGGWLATSDGLPLRRVSAAPSSRLALLPGDKPGMARWYQAVDGAVVEEFHIEGLEKMAAFDAGEFDLP